MNCDNLSGIEKDICEQEYCYSKGSSDKTYDSCICNEFCIGDNCDGPNAWKFTCDGHTGTGSITDEACEVCENCVCSSSETSYVPPTRVGNVSKTKELMVPTTPVETLQLSENTILTPDSTLITPNPNSEIAPLPFESTVVSTPAPNYISTTILQHSGITDTIQLTELKEHSTIFKFIVRKLKPENGARESLNFLYEKYSEWFDKFYHDKTISSQNEFNLVFYKLFENFEDTYLLNVKFDNYKIIPTTDNKLISKLNMIENNKDLVNYINDNLKFELNSNSLFDDIYSDYSDWFLEKRERNKKSPYEVELFLDTFFRKTSDKKYVDLKIKITNEENNLNIHYDVFNLFFESNIETSEGESLSLEEIYNLFVTWYSKMYPEKILIPQEILLSYLKKNYTEISNNIFLNLGLIDSNLNPELVRNNIVDNFFKDKLVENKKGNLTFNKIYDKFEKYVNKFYPNYKIPEVSFLETRLDEKYNKNNKNNYKLNFKGKTVAVKKKGFFDYIPLWLFIILMILILIPVLYFTYINIFSKPTDHFKQTFLYRQFLPYFASK